MNVLLASINTRKFNEKLKQPALEAQVQAVGKLHGQKLSQATTQSVRTQRILGAELSEFLIKHGFGVTTGRLM
jgi:hypothetical protein